MLYIGLFLVCSFIVIGVTVKLAPKGYQDMMGFHYGVQPADQEDDIIVYVEPDNQFKDLC